MSTSPQDIQKQLDLDNGTVRTKINNTQYSINMLPAVKGYLMGTQIIENLVPAIGSAADNGISFSDMFPEDRAPFTQIAIHLVEGMHKLNKSDLIDDLLDGATCNGAELDIHEGMRGRVSDLAFLIEFALKENFSDFFTVYIKERVIGLIPLVWMERLQGLIRDESQET